MRITWSLPVRGGRHASSRGDVVRAAHLIDALRREGHEVRVVGETVAGGATVAAYRAWKRRAGASRPVRILRDIARCAHGLDHARRVTRAAREQSADLIVETQVGFCCSGALVARRTGLPLVLDDCSPSREEAALGAGLPGLARWILALETARACCIVTVSRACRELLASEGIPRERMRIVPNGVRLEAYAESRRPERRAAVRRELGLGGGEPLLVYAGSFQPWHRTEILVGVLARLRSDRPVRLLLLGDGDGRDGVLAAAREAGVADQVIAPGTVPPDAVPGLLGACDVGILPGTNDYGHPMKLVEYAAAGLACVAPDLAVVREVLEDGITGLLFPPGDEDGLYGRVSDALRSADLRSALGKNALARVAQPARWENRARALLAGIERSSP